MRLSEGVLIPNRATQGFDATEDFEVTGYRSGSEDQKLVMTQEYTPFFGLK